MLDGDLSITTRMTKPTLVVVVLTLAIVFLGGCRTEPPKSRSEMITRMTKYGKKEPTDLYTSKWRWLTSQRHRETQRTGTNGYGRLSYILTKTFRFPGRSLSILNFIVLAADSRRREIFLVQTVVCTMVEHGRLSRTSSLLSRERATPFTGRPSRWHR
jgi:hypothetical protein